MYQYKERDLQDIHRYHERVQRFFYLSVPGALWFLEQLTVGGLGEKIVHAVTTNTSSVQLPELVPLAVAFTLIAVPFELSEHNMVRLKQSIRDYRTRSEDMTLPVRYTPVDHTVNTIMKFLFDKSPLPK